MGTETASGELARVLFGRTRMEVLALLLGRPDDRFYLREIVRAVGGGSGAVQRELTRLAKAGLVTRDRVGRQVYFSADRGSIIFAELRSIVEKTAGAVTVLRAELAPALEGDRVPVAFVYGSVARGDTVGASDVDLMMVGAVSLAEIIPLVRRAEGRLGREVNPSLFPVAEYRRAVKEGRPFLKRVRTAPKLFIKGNDRDLARLAR